MNANSTIDVALQLLVEPEDKNPNVMPDEEFELLVGAIKTRGFLQPVLVRPMGGGYELVDGVHRVRAARKAELLEVTAVVADLTDAEAVVLRIAMNKLRGELNLATVAEQVAALHAHDGWSVEQLESTGYSQSALRELLAMAAPEDPEEALASMGGPEEPEAPEAEPAVFTLEIALAGVSRREFISMKRRLKKLGSGDMGVGLQRLLAAEDE